MNVPANRNRTFEELRRVDESGNEYWSARELFSVLEYGRWEKFRQLIEKAKIACETAGAKASDHFHLGSIWRKARSAESKIFAFSREALACFREESPEGAKSSSIGQMSEANAALCAPERRLSPERA